MLQNFRKYVKAFVFSGNNVFCSCCNKEFITFLPFAYRHGAECPFCLSLERHRLISLFLTKNSVFTDSNKKLLHIAPEKCLSHPFKRAFKTNYVAGDKFTEGYTGYDKNTINLDVIDLKFPDNSFDYVICNHVLEHVVDDAKALREIYRILKPGGFAMLLVPIDLGRKDTYENAAITEPAEREKHFGNWEHVRIYGTDYFDRIKAAGFTFKIEDLVQTLSKKEVFRNGLAREEKLYIGYK